MMRGAAVISILAALLASGLLHASDALVTLQGDPPAAGFLLDSSGQLATTLSGATAVRPIRVRLASGEIYDRVTVIGFDERRDIVLLQLPGHGMPSLEPGDSAGVQPGQAVSGPAGGRGTITAVRVTEGGFRVLEFEGLEATAGQPILDGTGLVIAMVSATPGQAIPINDLRGLGLQQLGLGPDRLPGAGQKTPPAPVQVSTGGVAGLWQAEQGGALLRLRYKGENILAQELDAGGEPTGLLYKMKPRSDGTYRGAIRVPSRYGGSTKQPLQVVRIEADRIELVIDGQTVVWLRQSLPGSG